METALEILKNFCRADFVERNPEKAVCFLADDISWFGTAEGEEVHNRAEAFRYISDEVAQNPEPYQIRYTYEHNAATSDTSGTALVKLELCAKDVIMRCRVSACAKLADGKSKLVCMHMSVSNPLQNNEYFPVSIVEKREKEIREQLLNETVAGGMMGGYMEPDFPFYFINQRMLEILGYAQEGEFVNDTGGKIINCMHPDEQAAVDREVRRQLSCGTEYTVEYRMRRKDGSYIWVHDIGRTMTAENGKCAITSVCYDITEQKQAQQELALSRSKLAAVIRYAEIQTWEYDMEKAAAYIGDCSQGGYRISRVMENYPQILFDMGAIHPEDQERFREMHEALKRGAGECEEQVRMRLSRTSEYKWALCKYVNVFDGAGKPVHAIGMAQSLEQYKEMEEQFKISASQANITLWTLDIEAGIMCWNNLPYEFPGSAREGQEVPLEYIFTSGLIHPEDVPAVREKYRELYAGQSSVSFACRIQGKEEGSYNWFRTFYTLVKGRNGKPLRAIGTAININAQMEAEKKYNELVDSYQKFGGSDTVLVGNCNITKNRMLGIIDSTDSGLLERFGNQREEFFKRCSELVVEEPQRRRFLELFLGPSLREAYRNGKSFARLDCRVKMPNAPEPLYMEITVNVAQAPETQDLIGFLRVRNINERKMAQIKLEETKRLISRVIERDYDFIVGADMPRDTCEIISQGVRETGDFPGSRTYSEFIREYVGRAEDRKERERAAEMLSRDYIRRRLEDSSAYFFHFQMEAGGKPHTKKMSVFNINRAAGRVAVTCEDITEALRQERRQNERLAAALEAAKKANTAKSDFLSRMSHEIRTPMNAILGLTQLARSSGEASPDIADKLEKISASSRFLLSLVNDILDMSKIESQKMRLEPYPFRLETLVGELRDLFQPQAAQKGLRYTEEYPRDGRCLIGDALRIKQVLVNLLSNAVKFTREGEIHLSITEQARTERAVTLLFTVEDTGIGIAGSDAEKIFKAFEQAAVNGAQRQNGTGLGLAISCNLVELMGGKLKLRSEAGKGSAFYFAVTLPASDAEAPLPEDEPDTALLDGKRFLLAEDNDLNAEIVEELLKSRRAKVQWAKDGKSAVEMFAAHPEGYYDAILMDILMPVMTGLEATAAIRQLPRGDAGEIPIIAMTANAFQEDCDKAMEAGMNGFIPKPFEISQLYRMLNRCMKQ